MKGYLIILSVLIIFSLLFVIGSNAIPTCTYRTACGADELCVFEVLQENNTHIGSCASPYTTKVCCTEITSATIRSSCNAGEGELISMFQTENAHAGTGNYYSNIVCAKTTNNPVVTNVRTSCNARENCAVSVFQADNTHVGKCAYYSNSLCIQELVNATITMKLNKTQPNWAEGVQLQGVATRSDGTAINTSGVPEDVEVFLNGSRICTTETNSSGGYTCNFTAPSSSGLYQLNVTVDDPLTGKTPSNTTTFNVIQTIGEAAPSEAAAKTVGCYEEPRVVQNPDGTIEIATVRICIFK